MQVYSKIILPIIFIVFFLVYASISFVNQYCFRTYLDLGMINHAIYSFAHFKMNYFTLAVNTNAFNYFGDHFSIITLLYVPFYFLFGTYSLLVIQIGSVLFGGYGVYLYALNQGFNKTWANWFTIHFFGIWGIYSALSFDFHTNVVAAMFFPWFILKRQENQKKWMWFFYLLMIFSRESISLWLAFIALGLIWKDYYVAKVSENLKTDIYIFLISIVYFFLVINLAMPYLYGAEESIQIVRYGHIGSSVNDILFKILSDPRYIFSLFFENLHDESYFSGIKSEFHFMVLVSGGFLFLYRPYYLLMLLPIYAQKMLTRDAVFWGINGQYSIEFVPVLTIALIEVCATLSSIRHRKLLLAFVLLLTYYFSIATMDNRKSVWYDPVKTRFYQKEHYQRNIDIPSVQKQLAKIPEEASVSCSGAFAPHLAFRDKIYHFPVVKQADYIVLLHPSLKESYPLSSEAYEEKISQLKSDSLYQLTFDRGNLMIFHRR